MRANFQPAFFVTLKKKVDLSHTQRSARLTWVHEARGRGDEGRHAPPRPLHGVVRGPGQPGRVHLGQGQRKCKKKKINKNKNIPNEEILKCEFKRFSFKFQFQIFKFSFNFFF